MKKIIMFLAIVTLIALTNICFLKSSVASESASAGEIAEEDLLILMSDFWDDDDKDGCINGFDPADNDPSITMETYAQAMTPQKTD